MATELLRQFEQERDGDTGHENHDLVSTCTQFVQQLTHGVRLDARRLANGRNTQRSSAVLLDQTRELTLHTRLEQRHDRAGAALDWDRELHREPPYSNLRATSGITLISGPISGSRNSEEIRTPSTSRQNCRNSYECSYRIVGRLPCFRI